jgi:phosphatidylglycerol:prolipoprotein diacylglycerol transferase
MYNELLTIGPVTIYGYGLMIAIGVFSAYLMTCHLSKKNGLSDEPVFSMLIWGMIGGILGAKLLYWVTILDQIVDNPSVILDFGDGFVVYGGILGGILAGFFLSRVKKLPFWKYLDCVVPSIALAQGFGRIGCLLAGCCYGMATDSAFSITFTNSDYAPNNVPLVPTQILSSAFDFVNFAVLYCICRKGKRDGLPTACYLIIYGIGRFIIEFFRGDLGRGTVGVLSTSQFISVFIVLAGVVLLAWALRKQKKQEENAQP